MFFKWVWSEVSRIYRIRNDGYYFRIQCCFQYSVFFISIRDINYVVCVIKRYSQKFVCKYRVDISKFKKGMVREDCLEFYCFGVEEGIMGYGRKRIM